MILRQLLRVPTAITILLFTAFFHVFTSLDLGYQDLAIRIPLAFVSMVPFFAIIKLFTWLAHLFPRLELRLLKLFSLPALLIGGALRGWVLETGLRFFEITHEDAPSFRVVGGAFLVSTISIITAAAWSVIEEARTASFRLGEEAERLRRSLAELQKQELREQDEGVQEVSDYIMGELSKFPVAEGNAQSEQIESQIKSLLRPINSLFAGRVPSWTPEKVSVRRIKIKDFLLSVDFSGSQPHLVRYTVAVMTFGLASMFTFFSPEKAILSNLVIFVTLLASLKVAYFILKKLDLFPGFFTLSMTLLILTASGLPTAIATAIVLEPSPLAGVYFIPTLIVVPVLGFLLTLHSAAMGKWKGTQVELEATVARLRWTIARINLLSWYRRGLVSRLLHGSIQNYLHVASLRAQTNSKSIRIEELISNNLGEVEALVRKYVKSSGHVQSLNNAVENIAETWKELCEIEIVTSEECRSLLSKDLPAAAILVDLLQEICSNAIRHAGARKMEIRCEVFGDRAVVDAWDDGAVRENLHSSEGVGFRFINDCSINWDMSHTNQRNILKLEIPVVLGVV